MHTSGSGDLNTVAVQLRRTQSLPSRLIVTSVKMNKPILSASMEAMPR
jgi:hypothetical protein